MSKKVRWCIMRRDYSTVLGIDSKRLIFENKGQALAMSLTVQGHVVKTKVAKKILTVNKLIGRRD